MNSNTVLPAWVQIVGLAVPFASALIAGLFLIRNGRKRPYDSLEQLVKIAKDLPEGVDDGEVIRRHIRNYLSYLEMQLSFQYTTLRVITPVLLFLFIGFSGGLLTSVVMGSAPWVIVFSIACVFPAIIFLVLQIWLQRQVIMPLSLVHYRDNFEALNKRLKDHGYHLYMKPMLYRPRRGENGLSGDNSKSAEQPVSSLADSSSDG